MAKKRHTAEQITSQLGAAEVLLGQRLCAPERSPRIPTWVLAVAFVARVVGVHTGMASGAGDVDKPHARVRLHGQAKPLPAGAVTADWPDFLGPSRSGVSAEALTFHDWPSGGPTLLWEMEAGSGYAAPSVLGDRLVFFHRVANQETVQCLHPETGATYWAFRYPTQYRDRFNFGDGPRATPVIRNGRVFTHGAEGRLTCLDLLTGEVIWQRNTSVEFDVPQEFFGVASTPLVEGDLLIVNVGAPGGPCVVALNTRTGKTVWQAGDQWGPSYASPVSALVHGRRRIFVFAGGDSDPPTGGLLGLDPTNGTIDLRFPFRSKAYTSVNAATPVVVDDRVFVTSSYRTGCALVEVKAGGRDVAWKTDSLRSHFATPIYKDGHLYGFDEPSQSETALVCVDVSNGRRVWRSQPTWQEQVKIDGKDQTRDFFLTPGTLIAAGDRFLCLSRMGHLLLLDLSPKGYKEVRRTRLFLAKETWTPLALSRGLLYVTQNTPDQITGTPPRLLCYDLRSQK